MAPYGLDSLGGPDSDISPQAASNSDKQVSSSNESISTYIRDFIYPVENTRDPFVQVSVPVVVIQTTSTGRKLDIILTGIIWDDEDPIAIVTDSRSDSHLVRIGEEIGKAKILAIHPGSITIEVNGEKRELMLWPEMSRYNASS